MHTVGPQKGKITENVEKEKHTLQDVMWRGKLKKLEKEKYPLQDMEYGKKPENHGK